MTNTQQRYAKPPKWIIPLLAEPADESWRKILRHGEIRETPCEVNLERGITRVEDALHIKLGTRPFRD